MSKLLGDLKTKSGGYDVGNIRDILEDFRRNGRITVQPGDLIQATAGPAHVDVTAAVVRTRLAATLLGEIIHTAGIIPNGRAGYISYFGDSQIADYFYRAGVVMSVNQYRTTYPEWSEKRRKEWGYDFAESGLAHGAIDVICTGRLNGLAPKYVKQ
jgi:hypothetical protein